MTIVAWIGIVTFLISFLMPSFKDFLVKKAEYRSFPELEEVNTGVELTEIPGDKKVILTKQYQKIRKDQTITATNFLQIINTGPGPMRDPIAKLCMETADRKKSWELNEVLPTLQKGEEIYIPYDNYDVPDGYYLIEVNLKYRTLYGEAMEYSYKFQRIGDGSLQYLNAKLTAKWKWWFKPLTIYKNENRPSQSKWILFKEE